MTRDELRRGVAAAREALASVRRLYLAQAIDMDEYDALTMYQREREGRLLNLLYEIEQRELWERKKQQRV